MGKRQLGELQPSEFDTYFKHRHPFHRGYGYPFDRRGRSNYHAYERGGYPFLHHLKKRQGAGSCHRESRCNNPQRKNRTKKHGGTSSFHRRPYEPAEDKRHF